MSTGMTLYKFDNISFKPRSHCSDFSEVGKSDFEQGDQLLKNLLRSLHLAPGSKVCSDAPILAS